MSYPIIDTEKTARRLNYLLKKYHINPKDIQRYLSLSCIQTVYRWLDGTNLPSIDNLCALSQLFDTTVDSMIIYQKNDKSDLEYLYDYQQAFDLINSYQRY